MYCICQKLCCYIPCITTDDDDSISTSSSLRPLLDRSPPLLMHPFRRKRTYGTKKSTVTPAAAAIFGATALAAHERSPLADVTEAFGNVNISENNGRDVDSEESEEEFVVLDDNETLEGINHENEQQQPPPVSEHLLPLTSAYEADRSTVLVIQNWSNILPESSTLTKIAEASYAEVYRISSHGESSIIKVMQLKIPTDPASLRNDTASDVKNVVSEIRIMNALTVVPGFVRFKDAHLVQGTPPDAVARAFEKFEKEKKGKKKAEASWFPLPSSYIEESTFLVIELGDAGLALENIEIKDLDQVWDVFIGVVMALSRGEIANDFEHRDLHENNVCIAQLESGPLSPHLTDSDSSLKFGFSTFEVTLIDYGLSRAKLADGTVVYLDLEQDLALFHGDDGKQQFDNYRRMRCHLYNDSRTLQPLSWHGKQSSKAIQTAGKSWADFKPYNNVIWIKYLLKWLTDAHKIHGGDKNEMVLFKQETRELSKRLDTRTKVENGAFSSAQEVMAYIAEMGWVSEEQVERYGVDSTMMSQ